MGRNQEQATWEHGHGGYTGSLAEKDSFVLIDTQHRTREEAIEYAENLLANDDPRCDDKWGPAGALPYRNGAKSETQVKTINVKVANDDVANPANKWDVARHLNKILPAKYGKSQLMIDVRVISEPQNVKTVVKSSATKGKVVKEYVVSGQRFTSMAEARAHMDGMLREAAVAGRPLALQIECVQVRENGAPLASGTVVVKSAEYTVEIHATKAQADFNREPDGWVFFGWASS